MTPSPRLRSSPVIFLSMRALSLFPLLLFLTAGCYTYSEVPVQNAAPGASVRARVSGTEADRLEAVLGRDGRVLEGSVVENNGEELLLAVRSATTAAGTSTDRLYQRLTIPGSEIVELEARRIDPWRTAGVVAVGVGLAAYVAVVALQEGDSEPGQNKGGGNAWIGFRLPLRF